MLLGEHTYDAGLDIGVETEANQICWENRKSIQ